MNKLLWAIGISLLSGGMAGATGVSSSAVVASSPGSATASVFKLESGTPLSIKLLDYAWAKRESLASQRIIADYLQTKPEVPQNYECAWKTARLVSFIGNYGIGEKEFISSSAGVKLFDYGVSAAKIARALKESGIEGQYWYAIDLGSYGLAKGILSSAHNAKSGMSALRLAMQIDSSYQWYGSSRILGRYYQELPRFFGGDREEARNLLLEASEKAPQFRNNWVFLGQYYTAIGKPESAVAACQKALDLPNQDGKFEELRYAREAQECLDRAKAKLG